jgi:hypothetical protein
MLRLDLNKCLEISQLKTGRLNLTLKQLVEKNNIISTQNKQYRLCVDRHIVKDEIIKENKIALDELEKRFKRKLKKAKFNNFVKGSVLGALAFYGIKSLVIKK